MATTNLAQEKRLTDQKFWEDFHQPVAAPAAHKSGRLPAWLTRNAWRERSWSIISRYIDAGASMIEVGCAPGHNLMEYRERFGVLPYGVEFAEAGITACKEVFAASGVPTENIMQADVFDRDWQAANKERFDVVMSRGFIEHFPSPQDAIAAHINILRPGGLLVVSIPKLRYIHYALTAAFAPHVIPSHNLGIMSLPAFRALFPASVEPLFCGHVGGIDLMIADYQEQTLLKRAALRLLRKADLLMRLAGNLLPVFDTPLSSQILFVGRKCREA
jgi:2-polyprenyl-3-methyl-5-hydroxy-6-metoxy-1,4-benzoquinol methylase